MKQHVIVIHGGDTFDTYEEYLAYLKAFELDFARLQQKGWKDSLQEKLGPDFDVFTPRMPNSLNAKYLEWKIWFEKMLPFFHDEIICVGHSLGGIFWAKYLAENTLKQRIKAVFLVAPPFDAGDSEYSLADFALPPSLEGFDKQAEKIFIYHSTDDDVVPFDDLEKYGKALPKAKAVVFKDRGHFSQEEFPELVADIRGLV